MSSRTSPAGPSRYPTLDRTAVLRALVPEERRRVLSVVLDRPAPVGERSLAERVVADERSAEVAAVSESETDEVLVQLRQVHLPALADAGLLSWYEADAFVTPTGHPGLRDPFVLRLLTRSIDDDVVEALADRRRRCAVAVLQDEAETMSTAMLAREIAVRSDDPATAVEDVSVSLRHAHLPKLDAAGLVDYDREGGTVTYHGHPLLEGPWFGFGNDGRSNPRSPSGPSEDPRNHESD